MCWEYQPNIVPRLVRDISFDVGTVKLATYWNNMLHYTCQPNVTNIGLDIAPMSKRVSTYIFDQYWPKKVCY